MKFRKASFIAAIAASLAVTFAAPQRVEAQQQGPRAGQITVGNLIAALNNVNVQITRLDALNNLTVQNVRLVNVQDVLNDANIEAFNNALNRNNVEILKFRDVLTNNRCSVVAVCESLNNVLNQNNVAIGQVVAVDVLSGGDVILFYQPQQ